MEISLPNFSLKKEPGDYQKDGLLHCGKCNTPKECIVNLFGNAQKRPCLCLCGTQERDRQRILQKEIKRLQTIQALRDEAFSDTALINCTFDSPDTENTETIIKAKKYVENFEHFFAEGRGILFTGDVGRGKSYAACCIANALIDKCKSAIVSNFSDIANQLFNTYDKEEYMYRFQRCVLLVIDDFSMERDTQYMNEVIYNVIDTRYRAKKPLIVTTNLPIQQIKSPVKTENKRVYSRLLEMCIPIDVKGKDRRYKIATQKYYEDMKLLE